MKCPIRSRRSIRERERKAKANRQEIDRGDDRGDRSERERKEKANRQEIDRGDRFCYMIEIYKPLLSLECGDFIR